MLYLTSEIKTSVTFLARVILVQGSNGRHSSWQVNLKQIVFVDVVTFMQTFREHVQNEGRAKLQTNSADVCYRVFKAIMLVAGCSNSFAS